MKQLRFRKSFEFITRSLPRKEACRGFRKFFIYWKYYALRLRGGFIPATDIEEKLKNQIRSRDKIIDALSVVIEYRDKDIKYLKEKLAKQCDNQKREE